MSIVFFDTELWISQLFSNLVILHLLAYEDGTECSETSAYKIQVPGNYPEENIQHTEHGESLKSSKRNVFLLPQNDIFSKIRHIFPRILNFFSLLSEEALPLVPHINAVHIFT
jgi:hypothetical protein